MRKRSEGSGEPASCEVINCLMAGTPLEQNWSPSQAPIARHADDTPTDEHSGMERGRDDRLKDLTLGALVNLKQPDTDVRR
jgi:hypothetical protein